MPIYDQRAFSPQTNELGIIAEAMGKVDQGVDSMVRGVAGAKRQDRIRQEMERAAAAKSAEKLAAAEAEQQGKIDLEAFKQEGRGRLQTSQQEYDTGAATTKSDRALDMLAAKFGIDKELLKSKQAHSASEGALNRANMLKLFRGKTAASKEGKATRPDIALSLIDQQIQDTQQQKADMEEAGTHMIGSARNPKVSDSYKNLNDREEFLQKQKTLLLTEKRPGSAPVFKPPASINPRTLRLPVPEAITGEEY
jgi:hypothetical protein